jgi:chemotaxis response regulator CheB
MIGVILSGTATHGTLGLDAIKADGRITFAQDESARDDSMPCVALRGSHSLAGEHCERSTSQVASKKSLRTAPPASMFLNEPSHSEDAGFRRTSHCV